MASNIDREDYEFVEHADIEDIHMPEETTVLERINSWLQPTDYSSSTSEYVRHLSSRAVGTGEWIRGLEQFQNWHSSPVHGSIWIKAVPGSGKSVIAASMIHSLIETESFPVLFFFFRRIILRNRTPRSLVCDWLAQLCPHNKLLRRRLWRLIDVQEKQLESVTTVTLWDILLQSLIEMDRVYCVIDALDEVDIDKDFLTKLNALADFRPDRIKMLLTSRPKQYLQQALRNPAVVHIGLERLRVNLDIRTFVTQRLSSMALSDQKTVYHILDAVLDRGDGLFLYARLMLDQIQDLVQSNLLNNEQIRKTVSGLPFGLEEMYDVMLSQSREVAGISRELQKLVLELVLFSVRPLRLVELARAIEVADLGENIIDAKAIVRKSCGPLLEIVENETVQILHHSLTEYLLDDQRSTRTNSVARQAPVLNADTAHLKIAILCLKSFQSNDFHNFLDDNKVRSDNDYDYEGKYSGGMDSLHEYLLRQPLLRYSTPHWSHHIRACNEKSDDIYKALDALYEPGSPMFGAWLQGQKLHKVFQIDGNTVTPLHIAAVFGLTGYARYLINSGADLNALDRGGMTPLHWCAIKGRDEVAQLLVDANAEPDMDRFDGLKPLHIAAERNHPKVVKVLLQAGVSPLTEKTRNDPGAWCGTGGGSQGRPALYYAENEDVIIEMLPYTDDETKQKFVCKAAEQGNSRLLSILLPLCNELKAFNPYRTGPLTLAVGTRSIECVKLLLKQGADVNAPHTGSSTYLNGITGRRVNNRTCLHELAYSPRGEIKKGPESLQILELLIQAGADIEVKDGEGLTPLHVMFANKYPQIDLFETFLVNGAHIETLTDAGENLLHLCCNQQYGSEQVVDHASLLLRHGIAPNLPRTSDGRTAVHLALHNCCSSQLLSFLLRNGGSVDVQDTQGLFPIHLACGGRKESASKNVELLLQHNADINARDTNGRTCLYHIQISRSKRSRIQGGDSVTKRIIDLAFRAGFDCELRDDNGENLLLYLIKHKSGELDDLLQLLFNQQKPPNINCRSLLNGKTVLHMACQSQASLQSLQRLLDLGADPLAVDNSGNTVLHEITEYYTDTEMHRSKIEILLKHGVSSISTNNFGQAVLHIQPRFNNDCWPWIPQQRMGTSLPYVLAQLQASIGPNGQDFLGYTPLHYAAALSEYLVYDLLQVGANPSICSHNLRTPLHCAVRARNSGATIVLIDHARKNNVGVDLNASDIDRETPLHDACRSGRQELVSILLQAGAEISSKPISYFKACIEALEEDKLWHPHEQANSGTEDYDPFRPLPPASSDATFFNLQKQHDHRVCKVQVGDITNLLLTAMGDLSNDLNFLQELCKLATSSAVPDMLVALYEKVASLESSSSYQDSHSRSSIAELKQLISAEKESLANPIITVPGIRNPGEFIANLNQRDIQQLQKQDFDFLTAQHRPDDCSGVHNFAIRGLVGSMRVVFEDLKCRKSPLMEDKRGEELLQRLLHVACTRRYWNADMVKFLVAELEVNSIAQQHGHGQVGDAERDDAEAGDKSSMAGKSATSTALHALAEGNHYWQIQAAEYILAGGSPVDQLNGSGQTPLCIASQFPSWRKDGFFSHLIAEVLLQAGANPNHRDSNGNTPLSLAGTNMPLIRVLLRNGASVTTGDKQPLVTAVENTDVDAVRLYLEHGADANLRFDSKHVKLSMRPDAENLLLLLASAAFAQPRKNETHLAEIVRLLLRYGARLDEKVPKANTLVVHYMMQHAPLVVVDVVLETGCDLSLRDQQGRTVFLAAVATVHSQSNAEKYRKFLSIDGMAGKSDWCARDAQGRNVLMLGLWNWWDFKNDLLQRQDVIGLVQQKDNVGKSLLYYALDENAHSIALDLIENFDVAATERGPDGTTLLHKCFAMLGEHDVFIDKRQEITSMEVDADTPDKKAQREARRTLDVKLKLIEKHYLASGGNANAQDDIGNTPLFTYLSSHYSWQAESQPEERNIAHNFPILQAWGVTFTELVNHEGRGALHIVAERFNGYSRFRRDKSAQRYNKFLFKALMDLGCDPWMEDKAGLTPLDIAAVSENHGILEIFRRGAKSVEETGEGEDEGDE